MSAITATNANAETFPATEVEYLDMIEARPEFRAGARWGSGAIDCLGVVLEVYRRAGIGLPDPASPGGSVFDFADLFEEVTEPDQLYDLVDIRKGPHHLAVVVRPGRALSAKAGARVYATRVNNLRHADIRYLRLRADVYPV